MLRKSQNLIKVRKVFFKKTGFMNSLQREIDPESASVTIPQVLSSCIRALVFSVRKLGYQAHALISHDVAMCRQGIFDQTPRYQILPNFSDI
jgi:hypothetical protein